MKEHNKKTNRLQQVSASDTVIELSDEQLEQVAGGLNPQPLPPRTLTEIYSRSLFDSIAADRGIIVIGG
jgi:hypothetical protein